MRRPRHSTPPATPAPPTTPTAVPARRSAPASSRAGGSPDPPRPAAALHPGPGRSLLHVGCDDEPVRSRSAALAADLLAVVVFVLLGRRSHDEGSAVAGSVATAWPFVAGALVGEGVVVLTRRRPESLAAGAVVTAGAVVIGMGLRRLGGGGTPVSFVVVATAFLAVFILGWRLGARLLARRRVAV